MKDLFNNPWLISIVTSLVGGFLVYIITKAVYKRRDKSGYLNQIKMANRDVVEILQPYIADNGLPEIDVVNAIIASTARKYGIRFDEIYSADIICEELINEIICNVYVSSDKKREYLNSLIIYIKEITDERKDNVNVFEKQVENTEKDTDEEKTEDATEIDKSEFSEYLDRKRKILRYNNDKFFVSSILAVSASIMIFTFVLMFNYFDESFFDFNLSNLFIPIIVSSLILLLFLIIIIFRSRRVRSRRFKKRRPHYSYRIK